MSANNKSSIFITHNLDDNKDSICKDIKTNEYLITWSGQQKGRDDHLVKNGTYVFMRDVINTPYAYIGTVKNLITLEYKKNDLSNIKIYNSQDIESIINSEIENFSEYLGNISHDESFYLLMKHNWNKGKATEDFCNKGIHIPDIKKLDIKNKKFKQCMVCFDDILPINQLTICNEHFFCNNCWNGYLRSQINDGNTNMRCMDPKCTKHVTHSFIRTLFSDNPNILCKYFTWIINSFVQYKSTYKCCPNPKCELISFNNDIKKILDSNKLTKVIDFGCGMASYYNKKQIKQYLGVDNDLNVLYNVRKKTTNTNL